MVRSSSEPGLAFIASNDVAIGERMSFDKVHMHFATIRDLSLKVGFGEYLLLHSSVHRSIDDA